MSELFQAASRIDNAWSLAAFGVAAVVYIVLRRKGKVPVLGWISILILVLVATLSAAFLDTIRIKAHATSLYRVRLTALGPDGAPVENAKIWSSVGGEPKRVSGGWEFEILVSVVPSDGRISFFAAAPPTYGPTQEDLVVNGDYSRTEVLHFTKAEQASIRGIVIDSF